MEEDSKKCFPIVLVPRLNKMTTSFPPSSGSNVPSRGTHDASGESENRSRRIFVTDWRNDRVIKCLPQDFPSHPIFFRPDFLARNDRGLFSSGEISGLSHENRIRLACSHETANKTDPNCLFSSQTLGGRIWCLAAWKGTTPEFGWIVG